MQPRVNSQPMKGRVSSGLSPIKMEAKVGYVTALEMAEWLPLEEAVRAHFLTNCDPPIPSGMVPVAIAAIQAARAGDWSRNIDLPEGVTRADGATKASVQICINNLFLSAFLDYQPATEIGHSEGEQSPNRAEAALQETPCEAPQQGAEPFRATLRPTGRRKRSKAPKAARARRTATRSQPARSESGPTA